MKKPSAAVRTINMFEAPPLAPTTVSAEAYEPEERDEIARVPMEKDADRNRAKVFEVQEWTTSAFGSDTADENQYRMSRRGDVYYLETLHHMPGTKGAYGYTGVIIHKKNLIAAAGVIVAAARALRDEEHREG